MIAYQLTVPARNRVGILARVSGVIAKEKINIRAITISSFGDSGFFNLLVDDPKLAQKALTREGIESHLKEVLAVLIEDRPGGMDRLAKLVAAAGINIENAYGFVLESRKHAVMVLDVDDLEKAQKTLEDHKYRTLNAEALGAVEPFHYMKY